MSIKNRLQEIITKIANEGPSQVAKNEDTTLDELRGQILSAYATLCQNSISSRYCSITRDDYALIDTNYIAPQYLMAELNILLDAGMIGASLYIQNGQNPLDLILTIIDRAESLCTAEINISNDPHRTLHIVSLCTHVNLSLLQALNALMGLALPGQETIKMTVCDNLCGFVSVNNPSATERSYKSAKCVKRHGNTISQIELADFAKSHSVSTLLNRISNAIQTGKLADAIDVAHEAGVNVTNYEKLLEKFENNTVTNTAPVNDVPPCPVDELYNEHDATKFIGQPILALPRTLLPRTYIINGLKHWVEEDLEKLADYLEQYPNQVPQNALFPCA